MLTGNAICHRNPNWWIWCITTKNELGLHLNRPQWSSTQARARKHMTRARAQILISIVKSALLSRQMRSMTPICRLVKGYQNWYATSSGQPGDQSSVFYIIDIDWRWDQKLLLYFRLPARGINIARNEWFNEKNWGRFTWLSTLASFFPSTYLIISSTIKFHASKM